MCCVPRVREALPWAARCNAFGVETPNPKPQTPNPKFPQFSPKQKLARIKYCCDSQQYFTRGRLLRPHQVVVKVVFF